MQSSIASRESLQGPLGLHGVISTSWKKRSPPCAGVSLGFFLLLTFSSSGCKIVERVFNVVCLMERGVSRRKFSLDPPLLLLYYCGIDMNREFFIRVVFATYRVLDILPAEEFLKVPIKDVVNEILADLMLASSSDQNLVRQRGLVSSRVLKNLDLLYDYFTRVQTRHWIDEKNFLILVEEYSKI